MKKILLSILFFLLFHTSFAQADAFITKWEIKSNNLNLTFPTLNGTYDIDWGDGTTNTGVTSAITHTFNQAGDYSVKITGTFTRINFSGKTQLVDLEQWGTNKWKYISFSECTSLKAFTATDIPDSTNVVSISQMFYKASSFDGDISNWDVSTVTDISWMFFEANSFNGDISSWDVSAVTDMSWMLYKASSFNGDLSSWDVSSVTDMSRMFHKVSSFDGDLSNWNVSAVTNMSWMFSDASSFDGDISNWDVSTVTDMSYMFRSASNFSGNLSKWDVSSVTDMSRMFRSASYFDGDLSNWDVSAVINMSGMFYVASSFDGDVSNWDVSSVADMGDMFGFASSFNQDISNWNVTSVRDMESMFSYAYSFDQDLGKWDVSNMRNMIEMFAGVTLSTENYDALLEGWSKLNLKSNADFSGGNSKYCNGEVARQKMIDDYGWNITDGGRDTECTLGIDDEILAQGLSVYPNPSASSLTINSKLPIEKVEIFSVLGKKIKEINSNFKSVSIENLARGIYMVKVYSEKGIAVKKIIKQ